MKIVAYSGAKSDPDAYLIHTGEGKGWAELGIVVSMNRRERYPPFNFQSILARGYWEEGDHDADLLERLMKFPEAEGFS